MIFRIGIRPTILTGWGTLKEAQARFRVSIRGCFVYSTDFGDAWTNSGLVSNITKVYGYNIEVFKRGKHRKNKHYVVYRYEFPVELFKLLNVEIKQGRRTFKIVPKR
jgi:hypothetical protein